jgi:hypothetical protein
MPRGVLDDLWNTIKDGAYDIANTAVMGSLKTFRDISKKHHIDYLCLLKAAATSLTQWLGKP